MPVEVFATVRSVGNRPLMPVLARSIEPLVVSVMSPLVATLTTNTPDTSTWLSSCWSTTWCLLFRGVVTMHFSLVVRFQPLVLEGRHASLCVLPDHPALSSVQSEESGGKLSSETCLDSVTLSKGVWNYTTKYCMIWIALIQPKYHRVICILSTVYIVVC